MLQTAMATPWRWDVIFFNNGLHNLDNSTDAVAAREAGAANQSGQRRGRGRDVDVSLMNRGAAAAATWICL